MATRSSADQPFSARSEVQRQAHFERERALAAETAARKALREAREHHRSHTAMAAWFRGMEADEPDVRARAAHRRNAELFEFRAAQAADRVARLSATGRQKENENAQVSHGYAGG